MSSYHWNFGRLPIDELIEVDLLVLQEVELSASATRKPKGNVLRGPGNRGGQLLVFRPLRAAPF